MSLNNIAQIKNLFAEKKHVLIVFGKDGAQDCVASALALRLFLHKLAIATDIVSGNEHIPHALHFLPGSEEIKKELTDVQKFIIKVDVSKAQLETLTYDIHDNQLSIYLTPKQGTLSKNDLRTAHTSFRFDLIIILGTQDVEALGDIFFQHSDLFYRTPIINIDYRAGNEQFGHINEIDLTATSVAEVLFGLLRQLQAQQIDEQIATCLLAGMISQTHSFKTRNVTPHTLELASTLMQLGADREKIIRHLYQTRTLPTLKLWGEALAHLEQEPKLGLVYTSISRDTLTGAGVHEDELIDVVPEIIANAPEAKITLLIHEREQVEDGIPGIRAIVTAESPHDALLILSPFAPQGNKKQAWCLFSHMTLREAKEKLLNRIKELNLSLPIE